MKVLIGTTNPSKLRRFEELLSGYDIEFYSLRDLGIDVEPDETGKTPEENAAIKARFYGQYFDKVICNDSGLYFDELPTSDPRQPGLNIRSPQGKRLDDEEMIEYYSALVNSLGGRLLAYYLDGIAVYNGGKITTYMENSEATRASAFYMVDEPTAERNPGWPLDSISINRNTANYFTHAGDNKYDTTNENIMLGEYRSRLRQFMASALGILPDKESIRHELQCKIYPFNSLRTYKYVVICTSYQGKWILSRHKKRNTWETQGGHIEEGETPIECARRELFEESGVRDAEIYPVCDYVGYNSKSSANGVVFLAIAHSLGDIPESEMKETKIFDTLPAELTYPQTSPKLYAEAEKILKGMV